MKRIRIPALIVFMAALLVADCQAPASLSSHAKAALTSDLSPRN